MEFMRTSKRILVYLAALVWYIGGIMLFKSGYELVHISNNMRPGEIWPWIFIFSGIVLGVIQAAMIFTRSCRKNIQRISKLEDPRFWQFFRPGFFLALAIMITSGVLLNRLSQGNYFFMLSVAAVDFALTISLIGSSYVFWTEDLPE
jgi:hypothetical protein